MGKKISLGAAIAFMAIIAAATFSITFGIAQRNFNSMVSNMKEREKRYSKIAEIDEVVRTNYVDAGALDQTQLLDALSAGYLTGTGDRYAKYYTAEEFEKLQTNPDRERVQIGIVPSMDDSGYIKIDEVYPESPAQAADLQAGDLIVKIDETDITAENYEAMVEALYGAAGTKMTIVLRKDNEETTLEMTRRFVEVPTLKSQLLDNGIGLLTFTEFNGNTPDEFNKQLSALMGNLNSLVFDVRGVDKGTLDSVGEILDRLMPEGPLVTSTDKAGTVTVLKVSDENELSLPMAVLVNEKTSGEAELFAQVLKDGNKARVVGTKTAGKGTMQRRFKLLDGSAVEITTARYNPPVSPSFDGEGVKPDYDVRLTEDQAALVAAGIPDSDTQLSKAVEILTAAVNASGDTPTQSSEPSASQEASQPETDGEDQGSQEASQSQEAPDEEGSHGENPDEDADEQGGSSQEGDSGSGESSQGEPSEDSSQEESGSQ